MLFCLCVLSIFGVTTDGRRLNNYALVKRLSQSDPAHQLLWRNYNNYYYIDYDDDSHYDYYDEEEMGIFQAWFDFKMGFAEKILLTYLVGAKANIQDDFERQWNDMKQAISQQLRGNWLTDRLTRGAFVSKLTAWIEEKKNWAMDSLTTKFQELIIKGYNISKDRH